VWRGVSISCSYCFWPTLTPSATFPQSRSCSALDPSQSFCTVGGSNICFRCYVLWLAHRAFTQMQLSQAQPPHALDTADARCGTIPSSHLSSNNSVAAEWHCDSRRRPMITPDRDPCRLIGVSLGQDSTTRFTLSPIDIGLHTRHPLHIDPAPSLHAPNAKCPNIQAIWRDTLLPEVGPCLVQLL